MDLPENLTADKLAQRILHARLMETAQLEVLMRQARCPDTTIDVELLISLLQRGEHLTNWQVLRLIEGQRKGYFYNDWRILYLIGAGTFARVYRSHNHKTDDIKAIKVLRLRHSEIPEMREHFLREGRMVMRLRHPNIVPIFEVDEDDGRIYMVMDFVEGQNLREYVRAHKKLSAERALAIGRDIAAGLAYAAEHKISHRDMKLSNVLLSSRGAARLVDFGLATDAGDSGDLTGGPRSIEYAGLERASGVRSGDDRSDTFFLGCMMYHMLTGVPAMHETRERMKRLDASRFRNIVPITNHDPSLPHRAVNLVAKLIDFDPLKRLQTAQEVVDEFDLAIAGLKSGDIGEADPGVRDQQADAFAKKMAAKDEGRNKTVLVVDSNVQVQNKLREKLKEIGYRVLVMSDPDRALDRFRDLDPAEKMPADCIIFGSGGLGSKALLGFQEYRYSNEFPPRPAILLVGDRLRGKVKKEWLEDDLAQVLTLPLKFKYVRAALKKLLKTEVPD